MSPLDQHLPGKDFFLLNQYSPEYFTYKMLISNITQYTISIVFTSFLCHKYVSNMKTFFFKTKTQFLECCICFLSLLIFLLFETGCYSVGQAGLESLVFLSQHLWCWNLQVCTTTPSPFSFQSERFCTFSFIVLILLCFM